MTAFGMIARDFADEPRAQVKQITQSVTNQVATPPPIIQARQRAFETPAIQKVIKFIPAAKSVPFADDFPSYVKTAYVQPAPAAPEPMQASLPITTPPPIATTPELPPVIPAKEPSLPINSAATAPGFLDQELIPGIRNLWLLAGAGGLLLLTVLLKGRR